MAFGHLPGSRIDLSNLPSPYGRLLHLNDDLAGLRRMSDGDGGWIQSPGSNQTGCQNGVRIDLAGDGNQQVQR
jgi:hypothetical protein